MPGKILTNADINSMAYFARILQYGSFSEAARRLGVPLSTLSREEGLAKGRGAGVRPQRRQAN